MIEMSGPKGLLVRVGIDQTYGGWNAPCHEDGAFCYIPMQRDPEEFDQGFKTTYDEFEQVYQCFAGAESQFPDKLHQKSCHLDPDFRFSTYGNKGGTRANRISKYFKGSSDNFIVFYASFKPVGRDQEPLVYAIMGFFRFQNVDYASQVPLDQRDQNAHTRLANYQLRTNNDIVIFADKNTSGRLKSLINIGEQSRENQQYYVQEKLFKEWGGISTKKGWIQRGGYPPQFNDPTKFLQWFYAQNPELVHENNIRY